MAGDGREGCGWPMDNAIYKQARLGMLVWLLSFDVLRDSNRIITAHMTSWNSNSQDILGREL